MLAEVHDEAAGRELPVASSELLHKLRPRDPAPLARMLMLLSPRGHGILVDSVLKR